MLFLNILVFLQKVVRWHSYSDIFFEFVKYSKYLNNHNLFFLFLPWSLLNIAYLWHLGQYHLCDGLNLYLPLRCKRCPQNGQYLLPFLTIFFIELYYEYIVQAFLKILYMYTAYTYIFIDFLLKFAHFLQHYSAFLIWSVNQRQDWATIVCLVGNGQEINNGEGGIREWLEALKKYFKNWNIHISRKLTEAEYAEKEVEDLKKLIKDLKDNHKVTYADELHLSVSLRSFRSEKLSAFVYALLNFDVDNARKLYLDIKDKYPIVLTRDISKAKKWLSNKVRGSERTGVLITKESARYKPLSIHVLAPKDQDTVHWFLEDRKDTRASNYLEDAATEIQVQGLELDYTCLLWDADMRAENNKWHYYRFNGKTKWNEVHNTDLIKKGKDDPKKYMLNAYRVLLTRARMGMVICVPTGNYNKSHNNFPEDSTRLPEYYDGTFTYLKSIGIEQLD